MRYLAELVWAPQAIASNRELDWRQLDEATVAVTAPVGATRDLPDGRFVYWRGRITAFEPIAYDD